MWFLIRSIFFMFICVTSLVLANTYTNYQTVLMIISVISFACFSLSVAYEFTIDL